MGDYASSGLGGLAQAFARALEPTWCPVCGSSLASPTGLRLCRTCQERLLAETAVEYCRRCGQNAGPYELADGLCLTCRSNPWPIAALVRVGPHAGVLRHLILRMKYERQAWLADGLGRLLASAGRQGQVLGGLQAVVPVPCHWTRAWLGGIDHTRLLADAVQRWGGPPVAPLLRRVRWCRPQVGLSHAQRQINVRGSVAVRRGAKLAGKRIGLLDDVTTTGHTLRECARVLRQAGAADMVALVLARAEYSVGPAGVPGERGI